MADRTIDLVLGIIAIVLGVLAIIGHFGFGDMVDLLGIVLIVVGILILARVLRGTTTSAVLFIVLGAVLLLGFLPIPPILATILRIVVGVLLILWGIRLVK